MFEKHRKMEGYVPNIKRTDGVQYGQYLVDHVARCGSCHNSSETVLTYGQYLAGGQTITRDDVTRSAPNITASDEYGIGSWTPEQLVHFLRSGETPDNRDIDPNFCPIPYYRAARPSDLQAMALYLRTVDY